VIAEAPQKKFRERRDFACNQERFRYNNIIMNARDIGQTISRDTAVTATAAATDVEVRVPIERARSRRAAGPSR